MWIDLDNEEIKSMLIDMTDNEGKATGKQRIVIPSFDLYSKEIDDSIGNSRLTTFAYEIRTAPDDVIMLKNLLRKISSKTTNDIKPIPCALNTITKKETMRGIIIQQNEFINEANIVLIFGIMEHNKQKVSDIFVKSLYFIGMEPTRKIATEGKCLLVTTKSKFYCTQQEVDNLLTKYYRRNQTYNNQNETPRRKKK